MTNLSRRTVLTGAAAATLAPAAMPTAFAATATADKQNPGIIATRSAAIRSPW